MRTIVTRVKEELAEVAPPAVFFFVTFHIIAFTRTLILREYGISTSVFSS
jgi:hypothetical protein